MNGLLPFYTVKTVTEVIRSNCGNTKKGNLVHNGESKETRIDRKLSFYRKS